ncbi:PPOX class F420-dependent oxidoreductase [Spiractinospora alimapuensis]|uniref:PPOX class F420-dependent oxidoreductase n=1 Tax=Spiractinospora alimapuensis TaxID=2820884 RepID=UPI001F39DDB2|nr:PPOX class F420-dependent oxidoreductase [Spiractinospora alimapuensis]QVQ50282.1 PPOX class F420-dependent oxidoreductase [Spiractinospora alimapuensis]
MTTIWDRQVREFLLHGTRTAKVAYTSSGGHPLVAPVWFVLEGEEIVFNTGKNTAKAASINRDARITVCVDLEHIPYAFVQVQGTATLSEAPDELLRTATMIGERYMGPSRATEFGRRNGQPGELVVRVQPTKVLAGFEMTA